MTDPAVIRLQQRGRFRERSRANARAMSGAGVPEDDVLEAMNRRHLGVVEQPLAGGAIDIHLALAQYGKGIPFCVAEGYHYGRNPLLYARESLGAFRSPYFSIRLPEQQRWWCGIVWLEQNRGCPSCIRLAYQFADENGWPQPKRLAELLDLGGNPAGPQRGLELPGGPRLTRHGFTRGR